MPFPGQRPGSRSATCPGRNEKNAGNAGRVPAFFFWLTRRRSAGRSAKGRCRGCTAAVGRLREERPHGTGTYEATSFLFALL